MRSSRKKGNTLALTVGLVLSFVLIVAAVSINYGQLFGVQKQAASAVDAAALQAALDLGRVVIQGRNGLVALVDDTPPAANPHGRPVIGINTLLARVRLDLIIADRLSTSSGSRILQLALSDYQGVLADAELLNRTIARGLKSGKGARLRDKNGQVVAVYENAERVYDTNSRRLGKGERVGPLEISVGYLLVQGAPPTIPIRRPSTEQNPQGTLQYPAYVPVQTVTKARAVNFCFSAIGVTTALVENGKFTFQQPAQGVARSVVQVVAQEHVKSIAQPEGFQENRTLRAVATAQCGGSLNGNNGSAVLSTASGTLTVAFPQGIPTGSVNFSSVVSIINDPSWASMNPGPWFQARGGAVPSNSGKTGTLVVSPYKGSIASDTGGDALAAVTYDWIRSLGLRPNVDSTVNMLSKNFQSIPPNVTQVAHGMSLIPAAYANDADSDKLPVAAALFDVANDPRSQVNFRSSPQYLDQLSNLFGNRLPGAAINEHALSFAVDPEHGNIVSTAGEDAGLLGKFWSQMAQLNHISHDSYLNAQKVAQQTIDDLKEPVSRYHEIKVQKTILESLKAKIQSTAPPERLQEVDAEIARLGSAMKDIEAQVEPKVKKLERAATVMFNANCGMETAYSIYRNLKGITAGGVSQPENCDYLLVNDIMFLPPKKAASEEQVKGEGPIPTEQSKVAKNPDWATSAASGACQLEFFTRSPAAVTSKLPVRNDLLQPALATSSVPVGQDNNFIYFVVGDVTKAADGGKIACLRVPSPFTGQGILDGQAFYQATSGYTVHQPTWLFGYNLMVHWQVWAKDQNANDNGSYYADSKADGQNVNPVQWCAQSVGVTPERFEQGEAFCPWPVSEWQIRCPMPSAGCVATKLYHFNAPWGTASNQTMGYHQIINLWLNMGWGDPRAVFPQLYYIPVSEQYSPCVQISISHG